MGWAISARERRDSSNRLTGVWTLTAFSSTGDKHYGCDHPHPTAKEAEECTPARDEITRYTGITFRRV